MTSIQQRAALQRQIWAIANEVRGAVDGWDFKQYVLGALFYRFISENFVSYIEGGDDSVNYAEIPDSVITPEIKEDAIKTKGYFIRPSDLFVNVAKNANSNDSLNTDLAHIFADIEASAREGANKRGNSSRLTQSFHFFIFEPIFFSRKCLESAYLDRFFAI
ncbi:type I restriction-modification system subunit M N-terminal domain-containing protein [Aeromonas caviae]|uniref:type I restriction-modification system subunit M N-terminal domain-containing protein n=1 Tax=Aeromonas caviae TaxID=648 RepID=UPI003D2F434F